MAKYIPPNDAAADNNNNTSSFPQLFPPTRNVLNPNNYPVITTTPPPPIAHFPSLLQPNNLVWDSGYFSNAKTHRDAMDAIGINSLTIVNPYIHHSMLDGTVVRIDPSSLLVQAPFRFNIYSSQFR
jgi:hypothetical protein